MESAISAIVSELVSRGISFLLKKYADRTGIDQKREKMQQLLLRIHAVVEEADWRYITNPKMVTQLKVLAVAMYKGYHALDKSRYKSVANKTCFTYDEEEGTTTTSSSVIPPKRSRTVVVPGTTSLVRRGEDNINDVQSVLESLEHAVANMTEFVVLLMGCERIRRRPYDTYLYTDALMFGRHAEKQQILSILLNDDPGSTTHHGGLTVLPIIGGCRVGKKTLVSHACNNDRVRSYFSSILFIRGDDSMPSTVEHSKLLGSNNDGRTLAVVEITSRDVDDDDWAKFCKTVAGMAGQGSKVIIIGRNRNLARLGTVRAVFLSSLSREEYTYLFKRLAFGSSDESEYPCLASMANEVAAVLGGSLITTNIVANLLRKWLDVQWWLRVVRQFKRMVDSNVSKYGEHPKDIFEDERPIDFVDSSSCSAPSTRRMMPPRAEGDDCPKRKLVHVPLDLEGRSVPLPRDEFVLVWWESRIAPYTRYVSDVCAAEDELGPMASSRKRRSSI